MITIYYNNIIAVYYVINISITISTPTYIYILKLSERRAENVHSERHLLTYHLDFYWFHQISTPSPIHCT
jgi:hypothetical protein